MHVAMHIIIGSLHKNLLHPHLRCAGANTHRRDDMPP